MAQEPTTASLVAWERDLTFCLGDHAHDPDLEQELASLRDRVRAVLRDRGVVVVATPPDPSQNGR